MISNSQELSLPIVGRVHVSRIFLGRIPNERTFPQQPCNEKEGSGKMSIHLRSRLSIRDGIVNETAVLLLKDMTEVRIWDGSIVLAESHLGLLNSWAELIPL